MSNIYDNDELTTQKHGRMIANSTCDLQYEKYNAGQKEHGGKLWCKPLLNAMLDEALDFSVYVQTHMQQMQALEEYLAGAIFELRSGNQSKALMGMEHSLNIIRYGNPDGHLEEEN